MCIYVQQVIEEEKMGWGEREGGGHKEKAENEIKRSPPTEKIREE